MKPAKVVMIGFTVLFLFSVPASADAHGGFGGAAFLGFGLGLFTGFAIASPPVYVAPPAYYSPPPVIYGSYPSYVTAPVSPPASYTSPNNGASYAIPPAGESRCREWKLVHRGWESRWDAYYGRWQTVLVERWGWVGVPCNN